MDPEVQPTPIREKEGSESPQWQAALNEVPILTGIANRLIQASLSHPEALARNGWKAHERQPMFPSVENGPERISFSSIHGENARKGPNGEELEIRVQYENHSATIPNFVQLYGKGKEGEFSFAINSSKEKTAQLSLEQSLWNIRLEFDALKKKIIEPNAYYSTDSPYDKLVAVFPALHFGTNKKMDIPLNITAAHFHSVFNSGGDSYQTSGSEDLLIENLRIADERRKEEIDRDPTLAEELQRKGVVLPTEDYAALQRERIQTLPTSINWLEALQTIRERIEQATIVLTSQLQ